MSFCNNNENSGEDAILRTLLNNIGRVVTICTNTGGSAGDGFTGLVSEVCDGAVKLITTLPSAPTSPFTGNNGRNCNSNLNLFNYNSPSHFGTAVIIPVDQITCVIVAEV